VAGFFVVKNMSTISDILSSPPNNFSTTLSANISSSALTVPVNDTTGLGTEGVGVIFQKDSDGNPVTSSIEFIHWTGKSGNNLTLTDTDDRGVSGSASGAQAHSSGDTFEVWVHSAYYIDNAITGSAGTADNLAKWNASGQLVDGPTPPSGDVVGTTDTQTLTNKTLTAPVISAAQFTTEAYFDAEVDNGNSGVADTITWTAGNKQKSTLTDDVTYTFVDPSGPCNLILKLVQDATGSRDATWPAAVTWLGDEPTWSDGAATKTIIVSFYFDGTTYWGQGTAWEA